MKQIFLKAFTVFLIIGTLASCTQDEIIPEEFLNNTEACCGTGENPPPPPPPPPGDGSGG